MVSFKHTKKAESSMVVTLFGSVFGITTSPKLAVAETHHTENEPPKKSSIDVPFGNSA
jgi:hypothetical protein